MQTRRSKRDAQCEHCKRFFTKKGLKEHQRHVKCSPTSTATPRKWERARCKHCGKSFHSSNSLRVHVSTQHPTEYRKSPNSVKAHRSPIKHNRSTKTGPPPPAPRRDAAGRSTSLQVASRKHVSHSPASRTEKLKTDLDVEAMIRTSPDPATSRRIWETVLRQQQLQKDRTQSAKRHAAP